ncbi:hypothetical protein CDCA_CDCA09G2788 [Cyanidium caldarium]|uniref:Mitochondrial carrier protein n=1 Tax=Cyanidium caldarium TaxID=2771 RepID=A0AAV9IY88_CYACA|nr:hypothetical protein CDCA_CDCA09G2788 [Cyanidium caldarium]
MRSQQCDHSDEDTSLRARSRNERESLSPPRPVHRRRRPPWMATAVSATAPRPSPSQLWLLSSVPVQKLPRVAVAGGLAGAIVNGLLHPLDTVKSVRQADPARYSRRTLGTLQQLVRESGAGVLYRGILPAVIGAATSSSIYFGTYETVKSLLMAARARRSAATTTTTSVSLPPMGERSMIHMLAAASGNIASSIIFVPKEVLKQRLQAGREATVWQVWQHQHLRGLYWGYRATLLRNVPTTVLNFVFYEELKIRLVQLRRLWRAHRSGPPAASLEPVTPHAVELLLAGSMAGALSSALTTPLDVVKTKFSTATSARLSSLSVLGMLRHVLQQEGPAGLFRGVSARAFWAGAFSAIGFGTYEFCKSLLLRDGPRDPKTQPVSSAPRGQRTPASSLSSLLALTGSPPRWLARGRRAPRACSTALAAPLAHRCVCWR